MVKRFLITFFFLIIFFVNCAKGNGGCFEYHGMPAITYCDNPTNDPEKQNMCLLFLTLYQKCEK